MGEEEVENEEQEEEERGSVVGMLKGEHQTLEFIQKIDMSVKQRRLVTQPCEYHCE